MSRARPEIWEGVPANALILTEVDHGWYVQTAGDPFPGQEVYWVMMNRDLTVDDGMLHVMFADVVRRRIAKRVGRKGILCLVDEWQWVLKLASFGNTPEADHVYLFAGAFAPFGFGRAWVAATGPADGGPPFKTVGPGHFWPPPAERRPGDD